ncbi:hypothetical protein [Flavobacterium sp.]|uniref:hypothetical protein n=1 Tax=Flavobacterium sp. TaxID=239 RepID=UPI003A91A1C4
MLLNSLLSCSKISDEIWQSANSNIQLKFDNNWELIKPFVDTEDKVLVGLTDRGDHSSIVVKFEDDVSKEVLSDENYMDAFKSQMLKANSGNKLLIQDEIVFKDRKFTRLVFFMNTKYGDFIVTNNISRDGIKFLSIQVSCPKDLIKTPGKDMPDKFDRILSDMKI